MDYTKLTDYELICKIKEEDLKALHSMHERYFRLFMKQKIHLEQTCKSLKIEPDFDDYLALTYQAFLNAMNTIDLKRLPKPETWKAWSTINGYLMSRNRDIIAGIIKDRQNNISIDSFSTDKVSDKGSSNSILENSLKEPSLSTEDSYLRSESTKPFWHAVENSFQNLNEKQQKIWNLLNEGLKKNTICKELDINIKEYNYNLGIIQDIFKMELNSKMNTMDTSEIRQRIAI